MICRITFTLLISTCLTGMVLGQADGGKKIFQDNCTSCHSLGGGKIVGPDLQGVTERRKEGWIKKFIVNSQALIAAGDADAKAVFDENGQIPMPGHGHLKEADLNALIDYLKSTATAAPEPAPSVEAKTERVSTTEVKEQRSLPGYMYVFLFSVGLILLCLVVILYQLIGLLKKTKIIRK